MNISVVPSGVTPKLRFVSGGRCWRYVARDPLGTVLSVLAIALGVGLVAVIFAALNSQLLRGLPFAGADRLCAVTLAGPVRVEDDLESPLSAFEIFRDDLRGFEGLAAMGGGTVAFRARGLPRRCVSTTFSAETLELLRVRPALGAGFSAADERRGGAPVVMLSDALWRDEFERDPAVIGQAVIVDGIARAVVGVMPPRFDFLRNTDLWLPLVAVDRSKDPLADAGGVIWGRLRPGVSAKQAEAELAGRMPAWLQRWPRYAERFPGARVTPLQHAILGEVAIRRLLLMQGFAFFVLLIGCLNVMTLLLARYAARVHELGVRSALGATPRSIVMQVLRDGLFLAALGTAGGLALAWIGLSVFSRFAQPLIPFWAGPPALDGVAVLFMTGVLAMVVLVSALGPALRAARVDVAAILRDDTRTGTGLVVGRLNHGLVIAQIALAFPLLAITALMGRAVEQYGVNPLKLDMSSIYTARVLLRDAVYADSARVSGFFQQLSDTVRNAAPGARVALSTREGLEETRKTSIETDDAVASGALTQTREVRSEAVSPEYFSVLGVSLIRGRDFLPADTAKTLRVAIVNSALAERCWPGADPIGRRFRMSAPGSPWLTVVGVVPNLLQQGRFNFRDTAAGFYRPIAQAPNITGLSLVAHSPAPIPEWPRLVRQAIFDIDPNQAPKDVGTLASAVDDDMRLPRFLSALFGVFGMVAMVMAATGVYGLTTFSVRGRIREIGIRAALGATRGKIVAMIQGQSLGRLAIGAVVGFGFSLAAALYLHRAELLAGVAPWDFFAHGAALVVVIGVVTIATLIPATRAARMDPALALRQD